jgi:hypothetical protein
LGVVDIVLPSEKLHETQGVFALDHKVFRADCIIVLVVTELITNDTITCNRVVACFVNMAETTTVGTENRGTFVARCFHGL